MKCMYIVGMAALTLAMAAPALAQTGGNDPKPANYSAWDLGSQGYGGSSHYSGRRRLSTPEKGRLIQRDGDEIHAIKQELAQTSTEQDRAALLDRKHQLENEIIEIQQAN